MKNALFVLLAAVLLLPALAQARRSSGSFVDPPETVSQDVFVNVGGFAYGLPSIGYERAAGRKNSWEIEAGFKPWIGTGYSYTQLGLSGSYRWWIAKYLSRHESHALHGIYLGPQVFLNSYSFSYDTYPGPSFTKKTISSQGFGVGGGLAAGYQYIFRPGLLANAGLSVGYIGSSASFEAGAPSIPYGGTYLGSNLIVGWAF